MQIQIKEIHSKDFGHCVMVRNEDIELLVTIDYGPRIVSITKGSKRNLIYNRFDDEVGRYHGHKMRLTIDRPSNGVYLDNSPVVYSMLEDGVKFIQPAVEPNALELSMDIVFGVEVGSVMIVHSVTNKSKENIKLSIYTETPLLHDGFIFVPQSNIVENDRPSRILNLWNDTKWSDERLFVGDQYITVKGTENANKLKIGTNNTAGWCGYINQNNAFVTRYLHNRTALYPVSHCSTSVTAHEHFLSIQTYSPFYILGSMEVTRHIESWIFPDTTVPCTPNDEQSIDEFINSF